MTRPDRSSRSAAQSFRYPLTVILSWLIPGLGHFLLGFRVRGLILAVTLLGAFWYGQTVLGENLAVSREVHPVFFCLQAGNGLSAFVADALHGAPIHSIEGRQIQALPDHLSLGILFSSVAGLLNAIVILHVADPRTWREAARLKERTASASGPSPATA